MIKIEVSAPKPSEVAQRTLEKLLDCQNGFAWLSTWAQSIDAPEIQEEMIEFKEALQSMVKRFQAKKNSLFLE